MTVAAITHRQRPATASGITFINLEDEFGMLNVVATAGLRNASARSRPPQRTRRHRLIQRGDVSLYAHKLIPRRQLPTKARNFRCGTDPVRGRDSQ